MILYVALVFVLFGGDNQLTRIAAENSAKHEAEEAYKAGNYAKAIEKFGYLIDSLKTTDEKAFLNLAHAYYKSGQTSSASKLYEKVLTASDKKIKSVAAQQLGVISYKNDQDKEKALGFFKESLRADPTNAEARYNYELLKKLVDAKQDPKMNQNNKDQQKNDKQDQNQQQQQQQQQGGQNQTKNNQGKQNQDKKDDQAKKDGDSKDKGSKEDNNSKNSKDNKDSKNSTEDKNSKDSAKDDNAKKESKGDSDKEGKESDKKDGKQGQKDQNEQAKGNKDKQGKDGTDNASEQKPGAQEREGGADGKKDPKNRNREAVMVNPEALAKMGMNEARAKMLLDAMKAGEVQYIQQTKREPAAKSKSRKKPDW